MKNMKRFPPNAENSGYIVQATLYRLENVDFLNNNSSSNNNNNDFILVSLYLA